MSSFVQAFEWIGVPFGYLFKWIFALTNDYLLALFVFCVLMKLLLLSLSIRQQKDMSNRAKLASREKAIRTQYQGKTDEQSQNKMKRELMELYTQNGASPLSGCLPMLVQMPILFALYAVITKPLTYLCGIEPSRITEIEARFQQLVPSALGATQIQTISFMKEHTALFSEYLDNVTLPSFMALNGTIDLSQTPSLSDPSLLLMVPLLTLLFAYLAATIRKRLNPTESSGNEGQSLKAIEFIAPLMSVWISFSVPAIIGVYWMMQSLLDAGQQICLIRYYPVTEKNNVSDSG